jgi:cysteine-rich repeat protein
MTPRRGPSPIAALAAALLLGGAVPALALPDLVPEIPSFSVDEDATVDPDDVLEGCAGGATGRRLVRFGLRTRNDGADDLVMGDPGCPDCAQNPGAACTNPLYHCSPAHGHAHFEEYVLAELLAPGGQVVAVGRKQGFCLLDSECADPQYHCGFQGISAGCADIYAEGLPCQYIDITDLDLPDGEYTLRVVVDPDGLLPESNETNNAATTPLVLGTPPSPSCPVYTASDLPAAIPDLGLATSTVTVPPGAVDRVRVVGLRGLHTWVGDLEFRLENPVGTGVTILDRPCGDSDDFDLDLADGATSPIPCPPTGGGLHPPSQPLAAFTGGPSGGTWTLEVRDLAGGDEGVLQAFGLEVCRRCGNGALDPGEVCDDGNEADGDCCSSDCQSAAADGAACDDASQCIVGGGCLAGSCTGGAVSCDPCLTCDPPNGCVPPSSALCESMPPERSHVALRKFPDAPNRDSISWSWVGGSPVAMADFGAPGSTTDLSLCLYDEAGLRLSLTAPAGGLCGSRPCWKLRDGSIGYRDPERSPDGLASLNLMPGDAGDAKIRLRGRGAALDMPTLGLSGDVTVRLRRSDGTPCWQSRFEVPLRNDATRYEARTLD